MDAPIVFSYSSYLDFMNARIKATADNWGLLTKMAKAINCQRPYLSKVMAGGAHLTSAQGYALAKFWHLSHDETEFFLGLLEIERAGSNEYREYWQRKNADLKRRHEDLAKKVNRPLKTDHDQGVMYYSAWFWTAAHLLSSIPRYQTEAAISERLQLPIAQVRMILQNLQAWGYIEKKSNHWKFRTHDHHISKDSPLVMFHHQNWRMRALQDAQTRDPGTVHFTVVQSLSRTDYEKVKEVLLSAIQSVADIANPSSEEELMCFTCDLFKV